MGSTETRPIASGPLRACPANPRYFTDDTRRAIYLTGSHTWSNMRDKGPKIHLQYTRGCNVLYMDPCPVFPGDLHGPAEQGIRETMGHTLHRANRIDLASITSHCSVCPTGYCLANPGKESLACQQGAGEFFLFVEAGTHEYEWVHVRTGATIDRGTITVDKGGCRRFAPPSSAWALLYLNARN